MNNFLVELDLLSIKDNPQHNGKLKESKNCKLSVQKTRLLKSPQRLCSFKLTPKSTVTGSMHGQYKHDTKILKTCI